jgi:hypothetical protein
MRDTVAVLCRAGLGEHSESATDLPLPICAGIHPPTFRWGISPNPLSASFTIC